MTSLTVCLNVLRHPEIPVRRGQETYEQFIDRAWRQRNDDIDHEKAVVQLQAAAGRLVMDPDRPLVIRHSPSVRTTKAAELLAAMLDGNGSLQMVSDDALVESDFHWERLWTREEFTVTRRSAARRSRFFSAIVEDDVNVAVGGRSAVAERMRALRGALDAGGAVNHLWVSHGLTMPFIRLGVVEGLPPDEWTLERVLAASGYDYGEGFNARFVVGL